MAVLCGFILYAFTGLDVFYGDFSIDIVVCAHGDFDDDVGVMALFVIPTFETRQGATHNLYSLVNL